MKTQERKRVITYFLLIGVFLFPSFTLKATNAPITTAGTVCNAIANQQVTVPITVTGFSNISGLTLTMDYDYSKLHFIKASSTSNPALGGTCDIGEINMGGNNRRVTISWYRNGTPGITLPDGTAIANYAFTYISGPATLTWFDMGPSCVYNDPNVITLRDTPTSTYYINGLISGSCLNIPTITPDGPTSFCPGGSVNLTSSVGSSYLWSTGATTQSINITTAGSYTVEVTDAGGAKATSDATVITVTPGLIVGVSISASATTVCPETPVTFTATPTNGGTNPYYNWYLNGISVGGNGPILDLPSLKNQDKIICSVYSNADCVKNSDKSANSNEITMTVTPGLVVGVSISASATSVCPETPVTFTANPTNGGTNPSYYWYLNGNNVATTPGYILNSPKNNDVITCVLYSNAACVNNNETSATSNPVTMKVTSHGQWLGLTSDWSEDFNWCGGVPTSTSNVTIPSGVIQPVIGATESASCNTINITTGATLTLASDATGTGSLIVSGNVSGAGKVIAQRYMKTEKWNYVSSPVSGQSIHNFLLTNDNIAVDASTATGQEKADETIRGMMDYNPASNTWNDYFTNSTVGDLGGGKGFCMRTTKDGSVSFTGNIQTGSISTSASSGYWNCIGNPYTSAIGINDGSGNGANFLNENSSNLDDSYGAIYVWDKGDEFNSTKSYNVYSNAVIPYDFQQGQAFMIKMKSTKNQVIFKPKMQIHNPELELKSTKNVWPTIKLAASFNAQNSSTIIAFHTGMTNGLDPTYDAGLLKGGSDLAVYSRLVEDNGIPFAIQALPLSVLSNIIVPIGLDFKTGGKVAFSAELLNLPSDGQVILEDKLNKTFTDLSKEIYKTDISANTNVSDRFQIHISSLTTGVKIDTNSDPLIAFTVSKNEILIKGQVSKQAIAALYDIQGRVILVNNLKEGSLNIIQTPNIKTGIYMLSVKDNGKTKAFKIPVREELIYLHI
jgi:hypothetical protein